MFTPITLVEKLDRLYPNNFSQNDKYEWIYEAEAKIYGELTVQAESVVTSNTNIYPLTAGIYYLDILYLIIGDKKIEKNDFGKNNIVCDRQQIKLNENQGSITVVYIKAIPAAPELTLLAKEPYDKMYYEYVCAQIDFANRDFEGYNAHTSVYSLLFDDFCNRYRQKQQQQNEQGQQYSGSKIKNYW